VRALADVGLTVGRGEVFGLLGPNGAGKTTLIRILLDMIRPTSGRAAILGFDAQGQGVEARRHIGYLPSTPSLYARMTAAEMFEFAAAARAVPLDTRYVDALVERFDLNPERAIRTLSRGNQQKVGLVVALMAKPELVILDEPTTGLDPLMQEQVLDVVREVARDGRTVFFSSHILHEVEHLCDRIAVLREGEMVGVYDLAEQRRLSTRRLTVTLDAVPPADAFVGLPGVQVIEAQGTRVVLGVAGPVDALVKRLGMYTVLQIEAHEPTLEEFFFSLYGAADGTPPLATAPGGVSGGA
jgi:ABC-2 type transport system ATP-binding protein